MSRVWALLRRATLADWVVALAALALVWALLRPTWNAGAFRGRVESAIADVEMVSAAARRSLTTQRRWPAASPPGQAPPELSSLAGAQGPFARLAYTLQWATWEVVDSIAAPPEAAPSPTPGDAPTPPPTPRMVAVTRAVGAVAVHSVEEALLAELLAHYGSDVSFVMDTVWMLVLPERSENPSAP